MPENIEMRSLTDNLALVHLRAGTVEVAHDVGHPCLVAHGRSQVDGLLGVILNRSKLSFARSPSVVWEISARTLGKDLTFPR
jgi:hypothetical protein